MAGLSALVSALVVMTGGINCNSGLAAVMASCIGLSYLYNSIFGLEIEHFLRYTEPMQPM